MTTAAIAILSLYGLRTLVSLVNLLFGPRLSGSTVADQRKMVSVLIPARNEENNIEKIVVDVLNQNYHNLEMLVFDDQSTDRTAAIVEELAQNDSRLSLISSTGLPEGWLGKNYACHSLAQLARGDYFLFLDADVRVSKELIHKLIGHMERHRLSLISIFPRQLMCSFGEKITVPLMNRILLSLLPLPLVRRSSFASLSAANGQLMFFEAKTYRELQPHQLMKQERAEDIAIAGLLKKKKLRIECLANSREISCRMYHHFREAVQGFSKNVAAFFGKSYLLALLYWLSGIAGIILIPCALPLAWTMIFLLMSVIIIIAVSLTSRQSVSDNLRFSVFQYFALGFILFNSFRNNFKKQLQWKGRTI